MKNKHFVRPRCEYLDSNMKQCRRRTLFQADIFIDHEIYDHIYAVKVYLCPEHCLRDSTLNKLISGKTE